MDNLGFDIKNYLMQGSKSIKDYTLLVRTNLNSFFTISAAVLFISLIYALFAKDKYESKVDLKITKTQQNILQNSTPYSEVDAQNRLIAGEIEIIENYDTREKVAKALIDSFSASGNKQLFNILKPENRDRVHHIKELSILLKNKISAGQVNGVDIIEITAESTSPYEAALMANTYASVYKQINLENNQGPLTSVREFFEKQRKEKLAELNEAEDNLKDFKEKGGIISLDVQSNALISQLTQLDVQRDATKIDLMTSDEILNEYRDQVKKQNPQLAEYLESQTSQAYIEVLQKQIAELQMNRDLAIANKNPNIDATKKINEYDKKMNELKDKLNSLINDIKTTAFSTSPEQIKELTQKLIAEEINNRSLNIKLNELQNIISKYERNFNNLPKTSIDLARYERKRESLKELYLLIDQKYQEAMLNELSQPGNIVIIGKGRIPDKPAKPNRILIIIVGLITGLCSALGYIFVKDYFDDTIKSPADLKNNNVKILTWIPEFEHNINAKDKKTEFIVFENPDSSTSEAFRALRVRLQFSIVDSQPPKTILVTSCAEGEGKTFVSINLAASFTKSNKRTLLIDCDLRRPRIHKIFSVQKNPGLIDYLFNCIPLEEIMWYSESTEKLCHINSGSTPPDPAEVLQSKAMKNFLDEMKNRFDVIIIDSAPIVAVVDSEILSKIVDGTILVVSANKTETNLMKETVDLIKKNNVSFLGSVLNNFKYKNGYEYYFKYYHGYSINGTGNAEERMKIKS